MALVHETKKHDTLRAELMVSERKGSEVREPWRFVGLEVDSMSNFTPKELQELGRWLVKEGKRMGREYKSNGAPKVAAQ